MTVRKQVG